VKLDAQVDERFGFAGFPLESQARTVLDRVAEEQKQKN
jgi:hypothetical protein